MKAMYRVALMAAALVFLLPLSARSEIRAGSFEFGPFIGYNFFESSQNLKNDLMFGGRVGYNFTKHFGVEGAGEYISSRVDDTTRTGVVEGQFRSPTDKVDITFYNINAVYHFIPDGPLNPFILVGFGGTHYSQKISTRDMAAFNVGLGVKYSLTDNIALRFDVQDYMVTEIFQETYHNIGVSVGISFMFGGAAKSTRADAARYQPAAEPRPQPRPIPQTPSSPPKARIGETVVILAYEPKVEEKVIAVLSETKAEEKVIVLAFEDVHFDFDKSALKPEAQAILKRNIQILRANPNVKVRIAGYTSASGTEAYNQKLSERRANAVNRYLVNEGGIALGRLSTIGYGETRPAMVEAAPKQLYSEAAKANMRVLFEIVVQ